MSNTMVSNSVGFNYIQYDGNLTYVLWLLNAEKMTQDLVLDPRQTEVKSVLR